MLHTYSKMAQSCPKLSNMVYYGLIWFIFCLKSSEWVRHNQISQSSFGYFYCYISAKFLALFIRAEIPMGIVWRFNIISWSFFFKQMDTFCKQKKVLLQIVYFWMNAKLCHIWKILLWKRLKVPCRKSWNSILVCANKPIVQCGGVSRGSMALAVVV